MPEIFLVRHGQASFGAQDYDELSPLGRTQSRALGRWLRAQGIRFDAAWCGERVRQRDTALLALAEMGQALEPGVDAAFNELDADRLLRHAVPRILLQEGEAMLSKVQSGERIVTLEVTGKPWSTEQLAAELGRQVLLDPRRQVSVDRACLGPDTPAAAAIKHVNDCPDVAAVEARAAGNHGRHIEPLSHLPDVGAAGRPADDDPKVTGASQGMNHFVMQAPAEAAKFTPARLVVDVHHGHAVGGRQRRG